MVELAFLRRVADAEMSGSWQLVQIYIYSQIEANWNNRRCVKLKILIVISSASIIVAIKI